MSTRHPASQANNESLEDVQEEIESIHQLLSGKALAILTEDVQMEEVDQVPIKLDNAHIIGPFE